MYCSRGCEPHIKGDMATRKLRKRPHSVAGDRTGRPQGVAGVQIPRKAPICMSGSGGKYVGGKVSVEGSSGYSCGNPPPSKLIGGEASVPRLIKERDLEPENGGNRSQNTRKLVRSSAERGVHRPLQLIGGVFAELPKFRVPGGTPGGLVRDPPFIKDGRAPKDPLKDPAGRPAPRGEKRRGASRRYRSQRVLAKVRPRRKSLHLRRVSSARGFPAVERPPAQTPRARKSRGLR